MARKRSSKKKKTGLGADAFWGTQETETTEPEESDGIQEKAKVDATAKKSTENLGSQEENKLETQEPINPDSQVPRNIESQEEGNVGTEVVRSTGSQEEGMSDISEEQSVPADSPETTETEEENLGTQEPRSIDKFNKYTFPLSDSLRERMNLAVREVAYERNIDLSKALMLRMGLEMVLKEIDENLESVLSGMAYLEEREMAVAAKYTPVKGLQAYRFPGAREDGNRGTKE